MAPGARACASFRLGWQLHSRDRISFRSEAARRNEAADYDGMAVLGTLDGRRSHAVGGKYLPVGLAHTVASFQCT